LSSHGDSAHPESIVLTREEYLRFGDSRAALAGVLQSLLLTRHVLFVGTSMLDDDLIRIAHQVRSALQLQGSSSGGRRSGTVLALRDDPARARLWEQDVETVAMGNSGTRSAEAARRLEVLLDLIGCVSTPPTGYLLDPAYRGLLNEEERALSAALSTMARSMPGDTSSSAADEVLALLRRPAQARARQLGGRRRRPAVRRRDGLGRRSGAGAATGLTIMIAQAPAGASLRPCLHWRTAWRCWPRATAGCPTCGGAAARGRCRPA
jgi:hypothetical protein